MQFLKQNTSTVFIMKIQEVEALQIHSNDYTIDLYKEAEITSGNLSNLSVTNWDFGLWQNSMLMKMVYMM